MRDLARPNLGTARPCVVWIEPGCWLRAACRCDRRRYRHIGAIAANYVYRAICRYLIDCRYRATCFAQGCLKPVSGAMPRRERPLVGELAVSGYHLPRSSWAEGPRANMT
jgi:hypothetical protein